MRVRTGLLLRLECEFVIVEFLGLLLRLLVVDRVGTGYYLLSASFSSSQTRLQQSQTRGWDYILPCPEGILAVGVCASVYWRVAAVENCEYEVGALDPALAVKRVWMQGLNCWSGEPDGGACMWRSVLPTTCGAVVLGLIPETLISPRLHMYPPTTSNISRCVRFFATHFGKASNRTNGSKIINNAQQNDFVNDHLLLLLVI